MAETDDLVRTQIRIPAEVHRRLVEAAKASGRSMNAELVHRLGLGLGFEQGFEIPDFVMARLEKSAEASGNSIDFEFRQFVNDATDPFLAVFREALDPFRADIQKASELNYRTFKQEIARRLNPDKSVVTYGFELTVKNEAELTPAAALVFLSRLVDEVGVDLANLSSLSVRLVTPAMPAVAEMPGPDAGSADES